MSQNMAIKITISRIYSYKILTINIYAQSNEAFVGIQGIFALYFK